MRRAIPGLVEGEKNPIGSMDSIRLPASADFVESIGLGLVHDV